MSAANGDSVADTIESMKIGEHDDGMTRVCFIIPRHEELIRMLISTISN